MRFEHHRHYYRGYFFETFKRPAQAILEYQLALTHNPRFAKAAACLAHLYASLGQYAQAERYFTETVRLAPLDADMHFNLGYVYDQQGKAEQAIAAFEEAVRLKPAQDRAWYGMGMAHAKLGRHEEAAKALEEAARLQPMNEHAWHALGMAYHHLGNAGRVKEIALHLHRIAPLTCRQLIRESGRADLEYLVKDMAV